LRQRRGEAHYFDSRKKRGKKEKIKTWKGVFGKGEKVDKAALCESFKKFN